jgi:hypothetical protein
VGNGICACPTHDSAFDAGPLTVGSCSVCYGANGDGRGVLGTSSHPNATDLRSHDAIEKSDAQMFWIIENGLNFTGMPGFADQYSDQDIWSMVTFIRALQDPNQVTQHGTGGGGGGAGGAQPPAGQPGQRPVGAGAPNGAPGSTAAARGAAGGGPGGANVGQGQPGGARRCALLRAGLPVVSRGDGKCASEFEPAGSAAGPRPSAPSGREDPVCLGTDRRSSLTRSSLTSRRTWTH